MKRIVLPLIGLLAFIEPRVKTNAVEVISNLGELWPEAGTIGDIRAVLPGETYANTFWTGAGSFVVSSVTLEHFICCGEPRQNFHVKIYKEVFVPPFPNITVLGELGNPVTDPTPTQWPGWTEYVTYTPFTSITLEPYSLYWVAASEPLDGLNEAGLLFAVTPGYTGLCNWQLGHFGWHGYFDNETNEERWGPDFERLQFRVEAAPVDGQLPPCNHSPDVSAACASISTLWPPNSEMVPIRIEGVTDSDGDPVAVEIVSIRQDEPVITPDLDATTPDGTGLGTDTAQVRAERLDNGNGRVYKITFLASDGNPNSFAYGDVFVSVPHDRGTNSTAIDDGPNNGYYHSRGY